MVVQQVRYDNTLVDTVFQLIPIFKTFSSCIEANLNGVYRLSPRNNNYVGIVWEKWLGDYSLKATKMMIRPKVEWPTRSTDGDNDSSNSKPPDDP